MRWGTAGRIALGWLITIPASGVVGAVADMLSQLGLWGVILDVVLAMGAILTVYLIARKRRTDARHFTQPAPGVFVRPKRRKKKGSPAVPTTEASA